MHIHITYIYSYSACVYIQALLNTFNIIIPSIFIYVLHVFKSFNYVIYIFLYINTFSPKKAI